MDVKVDGDVIGVGLTFEPDSGKKGEGAIEVQEEAARLGEKGGEEEFFVLGFEGEFEVERGEVWLGGDAEGVEGCEAIEGGLRKGAGEGEVGLDDAGEIRGNGSKGGEFIEAEGL